MLNVDIKKAKTAELEAELALYQKAGITVGEAKNNAERAALIEELQKEHGYPVELTPEFEEANSFLAKVLRDNGAEEGEIVFAEEADVETALKLAEEAKTRLEIRAELEDLEGALTDEVFDSLTNDELQEQLEKARAAKAAGDEGSTKKDGAAGVGAAGAPSNIQNGATAPAQKDAAAGPELVYLGKTVTRVTDVIVSGRTAKDVTLADGNTLRLQPDEFARDVKPRS